MHVDGWMDVYHDIVHYTLSWDAVVLTQRSSEETRCEERHRSTRMDQTAQGGLGSSNSQACGDQPFEKDVRGRGDRTHIYLHLLCMYVRTYMHA